MGDLSLKEYISGSTGMPNITNAAGSLIAQLDAVLVDGFNSKAITSMTRVGQEVTVITTLAHGLGSLQIIKISGADQAEYNAQHRIKSVVSSVEFKFDLPAGQTPATPATGASMSVMRAPAGWTKVFSGTDKAVYAPGILNQAAPYLIRVDDTFGAYARIQAYHSMTDVDFGSNSGLQTHFGKSNSGSVRSVRLYADESRVVYFNDFFGVGRYGMYAFGEFPSYKLDDQYNVLFLGYPTAGDPGINSTSNDAGNLDSMLPFIPGSPYNSNGGCRWMKSHTQVGGVVNAVLFGSRVGAKVNTSQDVWGSSGFSYPNAVDNGLYLAPIYAGEHTPAAIRSSFPGVYEPLCYMDNVSADILLSNVDGFGDRRLRLIKLGYHGSSSDHGHVLVDMYGPWV